MADGDLAKANHALLVLRQARLSRRDVAASIVGELSFSEAEDNGANPDMEGDYQTAWAAIDELAVSLNTPAGFTSRLAWQKALDAVDDEVPRISVRQFDPAFCGACRGGTEGSRQAGM